MASDPDHLSSHPSNSDRPSDFQNASKWRSSVARVLKPLQDAAQAMKGSTQAGRNWIGQWFDVGEEELQKVLEQVRQSLPTTEVILIGKAQTGKSSIVRALTGTSAEIIGQGFRPHTSYTQQYAYPTADLPLLNFIDTVGLGEGLQDPAAILAELKSLLNEPNIDPTQAESSPHASAQIVVITVRISGFALDALHCLLQDLRQAHPHVPCLLAITCLHELYPSEVQDHPDYPPDFPEVKRAINALQKLFSFCDRTALIDFTLEEDQFTPTFYGLEPFVESVAELLPAAEAQVIHQLLQAEVGDQIGDLYRDAGRRYILPFSVMAATLTAVPLPFATMPVLIGLQLTLVTLLGRLYGQTVSPAQAGGIASAIAGGFGAQLVGRELVKFIPGLGSVIAASWAGAYTWTLGEGACLYFGDLMGGRRPDPKKIQSAMKEVFAEAQERFRSSAQPPSQS